MHRVVSDCGFSLATRELREAIVVIYVEEFLLFLADRTACNMIGYCHHKSYVVSLSDGLSVCLSVTKCIVAK